MGFFLIAFTLGIISPVFFSTRWMGSKFNPGSPWITSRKNWMMLELPVKRIELQILLA